MIPKMFCKQGTNTPIIVPDLIPEVCKNYSSEDIIKESKNTLKTKLVECHMQAFNRWLWFFLKQNIIEVQKWPEEEEVLKLVLVLYFTSKEKLSIDVWVTWLIS